MVETPLNKIKLKVKGLSTGVSTSLSNVANDEAVAENEEVLPVPVSKVKQKLKGWKGWVVVGEGEVEEIGAVATNAGDVGLTEGNCKDHDGIGSTTERRSLRNKRKRA